MVLAVACSSNGQPTATVNRTPVERTSALDVRPPLGQPAARWRAPRPVSTAEGIAVDPSYPAGFTHGIRITNGWYGFDAPATKLEVTAGAQTGPLDGTFHNGMIYVLREPEEGFALSAADRPGGTVVPLPTSSPVKIVAVDGHLLTVAAADGATFRFDVDSMKLK